MIGGFSCVNTQFAFDSLILLPENETAKYKLIYDVKINDTKQKKRITTKILKMDKNNQYGNAMTKPLPFSCTKKASKVPTLLEFNVILNGLSHKDKIGHLIIADNKNEKTVFFNEIYTPIFEKNKVIQAHQRSALQFMSVLNRNKDKDLINNFKSSAKTRSTLDEQKFIPLYAEHIHFLIKRAGLLVTKIYQHFTFEKSKFKKNFVVMNQKPRQKATSPVERDFYKILNNSNFGTNCRINIENYILETIYGEINEIAYIKKIDNIFDNDRYSQFSGANIVIQEVNEKR